MSKSSKARVPVFLRLGFWSANASAALAIGFAILALAFAPAPWSGIEGYAAQFDSIQMASFLPVIVLPPVVLVLMCSLHYYGGPTRRVFTLAGVGCSVAYAAIICTNYYVQLFVVRLNIQAGEVEGLSLLAMPNLHSAFFALESVGYAFLSLAMLAVSPVFEGGRLCKVTRWLYAVSGALGILGAAFAPLDKPLVVFAGLAVWNLVFPTSMVLTAVLLKRQIRRELCSA